MGRWSNLIRTALPYVVGLVLAIGCWSQASSPISNATRVEQLKAGLEVFEEHCARCHDVSRRRVGIDIYGTRLDAQALAWHGSVRRLFNYVSTHMPFDRPGTLSDENYYDVIAFLLYKSDLLPYEITLGPSTLNLVDLPPYDP